MALDIRQLLKVMVDRDASDVDSTVDLPANYRVQGTIQPIGDEIVTMKTSRRLRWPLCGTGSGRNLRRRWK